MSVVVTPLPAAVILLSLTWASAWGRSYSPGARATEVVYDGKLRVADSDGRLDAYLAPPFPSSHASFIETIGEDGSLALAWFCGVGEGQDLNSIVMATLNGSAAEEEAGEGVWGDAEVVSQREGYSNQNPVLLFDDDGSTLHLFHSQQVAGANESSATVWYRSATCAAGGSCVWDTDEGGKGLSEVFSTPGSYVRNRITKTSEGGWLLPMYYSLHSAAPPLEDYSHVKVKKGVLYNLHAWLHHELIDMGTQVECEKHMADESAKEK